jgi:hypothetical protein
VFAHRKRDASRRSNVVQAFDLRFHPLAIKMLAPNS